MRHKDIHKALSDAVCNSVSLREILGGQHFEINCICVDNDRRGVDLQVVGIYVASITLLPGNNQVALFHTVAVVEKYKGQGVGTAMLKALESSCRCAGIRSSLCTVRLDNERQQRLLSKSGWAKVFNVSETAAMWAKRLDT